MDSKQKPAAQHVLKLLSLRHCLLNHHMCLKHMFQTLLVIQVPMAQDEELEHMLRPSFNNSCHLLPDLGGQLQFVSKGLKHRSVYASHQAQAAACTRSYCPLR